MTKADLQKKIDELIEKGETLYGDEFKQIVLHVKRLEELKDVMPG